MKTVVITGANVGIGFAAARFVAALPQWQVVLACRNTAKANAAIATIRKARPDSSVTFVPLDLFSLASVRRFPQLLTENAPPPLDGLILNAGGINMKTRSLEFSED
jgi:NAD(P)-dependent dehydrogenase (short-subunit alcohol dehydrogenase family)